LSDVDPANFQWREILEATHQRVGEVLLKQKDFAGALAEFQTYLSLAEDMQTRVPTNGSALFDVANALEKIGDVLREQGDLAGALAYYSDSHKAALELSSKGWGNNGWQKLLAMSYQRMGMTLEAQGRVRISSRCHFWRRGLRRWLRPGAKIGRRSCYPS
jgi:tetratricopeptide (TPR) repeat protein